MKSARYIVIGLFVVSLLAGLMTGSSLYYRLSYLWALLLAFSWGMTFIALRGVKLTRHSRALRSQVGHIFEERYEITNSSRLPRLWIEVKDEAPLPGSRGSHVLTLIGGRESRSYLARTRLTDRGVFPLGPSTLISGDLFGLFQVERSVPSEDSLLVYPMLVDVRGFPGPPGLLPGGEALRRRTAQITSNAAGVRDYAPGDPLNRIHWVSTARRNQLIVKEFELDPLAEVWIFLDVSISTQASLPFERPEFDPKDIWRHRIQYELPPSTVEYAICIAGSLARYYIQKGRTVGMVSADQAVRIIPADRGGRQLGKILEMLSLLQPEGNLPIESLVETQARHLPRGSTVVMITANTSNAVYKTTDIVMRRGLRPVAVLVDAATFGGFYSVEPVAVTLRAIGIPVCKVSKDDNLSETLSNVVSRPQL